MTLIRRGDSWGVKVWDPGARRYRWVGTFASETDAAQAERDALADAGHGDRTVAQWARAWLRDYPRSAASTRNTYSYAARTIVAALGARRLDDIPRPEARRLALGWPRCTTRVARAMWSDAVRDGVCGQNPFTGLRLESAPGRKDITALTESEVRGLAALALNVHEDYGVEAAAIILTLGFVGVRPGELCTLRRADLDLDARELIVRFNRDSTGQEKTPKNGKARIVTVPPAAADALAQIPTSLDGYLLHTRHGRRLSKSSLHYLWRPVLAAWMAAGGRDLDLYELRHAAATILVERGVQPSDVAVQLGHTDGGKLVMELYGHPSEDRARDRLKMAFADRPGRTVAARGRRA